MAFTPSLISSPEPGWQRNGASMIGENRPLVTNEPVEFEKQPVEVQDFREFTDHFRGIYRIYLKLMKEHRKMSTCNRLDLETLGSWLVILKILPKHCVAWFKIGGFKPRAPTVHSILREEARMRDHQSVVSGPCDRLLSYEGARSIINKYWW
jgi:hypothetical protein